MLARTRRVPLADALRLAARFASEDRPGQREFLIQRLDRIVGTCWPDSVRAAAFPSKVTRNGGLEDTLTG